MQDESSSEKEKTSTIQWVLMLVSLSLIAGAVGWFLGDYFQNIEHTQPESTKIASSADTSFEEKSEEESLDALPSIIKLPTLLVNLSDPSSKRIRLDVQLAVKAGEKISTELAADIASDFILFLKNSTLDQIKGATGIFYLRQDLLNRARIRSGDKVAAVLITSLIIE